MTMISKKIIILKFDLNRLDVGGINHSSELYSKFMPFVSQQVTEWLKNFFSSHLDHAGANHELISKLIREEMFTEQDNLHPCHSCSRISQILNLYIPWLVDI